MFFPIRRESYAYGRAPRWRRLSARDEKRRFRPICLPRGGPMDTSLTQGSRAPEPAEAQAPSRWGAFASFAFLVIWTASTIANVGIAMFDTATGWLMASMSPDPMVVSLIQTATSLPLF